MKHRLPKGWLWARCHDVIDVRDGTHDTPKKVESGIPMVTSKNLKPYGINFDDVTYISEEDYEAIEKRSGVDDGDILFAMIGTIGNPVLVKKDRPFSIKNVALFKIDEMKVHAAFFKFMLDSPVITKQLDANSRGGNQKFVSLSSLRNMQIPLPSLPEQKRIAAILDKADSVRRKQKEAAWLAEELLSSAFLDMFGDPETNPKGVEVVQLSKITTRITDGVHQKPNYTETGVPFISVKDVSTGTLKFDNCKFVSLEDHQSFTKRCKAEKYDLLYTKVGTYGRPALVNTDREFSLYVSVCLIKPKKEMVDSSYLNAVLGTAAVKRQADKRIKGIGVPDLHLDQIQQLLIPLPAMEEQREFASRVAAIEKLKSANNAALEESNTLFNSLLQRAFMGEL